MSAIYNKIKTTIYPFNGHQKKISTVSKASSGFEETEDFMSNEIIINVLDENNNNHLINEEEEEAKPQIVTRCLMNRSDSVNSQPTRKVSNSAKISLFIDAVREMNQIVLIPSILRDIELDANDPNPLIQVGCDMYTGYQLLNTVKNSLIYCSTSNTSVFEMESPKLVKQQSVVSDKKEYLKELSVDKGYASYTQDSGPQSLSSTSSVNMDDDIESNMGIDVPDLALNFYHHLHGLNAELERLIEAAKFITEKYEQNSFLS